MTIPGRLEERLRNRRVVPFVGAGVSMAVLRRDGRPLFPSWHQLLLAGADRLEQEGQAGRAELVRLLVKEEGDVLDAAKRLKKQLGPAEWADLLRGQIDVPRSEVDDESLALARAVWTLGSRLLVTTNYDRVLDWSCPDEELDCWDVEQIAEQARFLQDDYEVPRATVWHLHGRIGNAARIVLTPDGYEHLYDSKESEEGHRAALETLRHLLAARTFLFIGFSLEDEHFGIQLKGLRDLFQGYAGRHYALVRPQDVDRIQSLGVVPVEFEDFDVLAEVVESLERWSGASGLARLDFRWGIARRYLGELVDVG